MHMTSTLTGLIYNSELNKYMIMKTDELKKAITDSDGGTGIVVVELYDDGEVKLEEFRVMVGDMVIAKSWRESYKGKPKSGQSGDSHHYTLPVWYTRYKNLNEIL